MPEIEDGSYDRMTIDEPLIMVLAAVNGEVKKRYVKATIRLLGIISKPRTIRLKTGRVQCQ